jgi:RNA polymerase sigma-70 factor (ECF subfamily)
MVSDEKLWGQIREGERSAFGEFYRQQLPRLRSYLSAYIGSRTAADDIAQEAFLQLWKHPDGFDPNRSGLRTYLFTIARRRAVDWCRRSCQAAENPVPPVGPKAETSLIIEDLLLRLDPDSRSLLWLREVEGYSYEELALMFEIPVGTVKSRLFTARQRLRERWRRR